MGKSCVLLTPPPLPHSAWSDQPTPFQFKNSKNKEQTPNKRENAPFQTGIYYINVNTII
ncbi:unnamed protein product [Meloidogyne enterolobii]|uniref:Uncharacterized protein n=1 Tax=Meloidogyne enterolobii TaxID=390850 RepID=A0ACB0ZPI5_MELEN